MRYVICLLVLLTPKIAITEPSLKQAVLERPVTKPSLPQKTGAAAKSVDKTSQVRQAEVVDLKTTKLYYDLAALKEAIRAVCTKSKQYEQTAAKE